MATRRRGEILVVAGTNGAGKSSVIGHFHRTAGSTIYNPDDVARKLRGIQPGLGVEEANARAWQRGVDELRKAIRTNGDFAFETTLGGTTVPSLLEEAHDCGLDVHVLYVALESSALHVERVKARARAGGHDIPEAKIHERYDSSRANLIHLLAKLASLRPYDNSAPPDPDTGDVEPLLILHVEESRVIECLENAAVPEWAREIVRTARSLAK